MEKRKTVYFFCTDPAKDEVAPRFEASQRLLNMVETDMKVDGYPVLCHDAGNGNLLYYVRTETVICMVYDRYLPAINELFSDCTGRAGELARRQNALIRCCASIPWGM